MVPRRLSGGWHRRRPTARPLTVGVDVAQQPRDFRWTAPPPLSSPAIPNGRRLTAQQPRDFQRTALHRPTVLHPPQRMLSALPGGPSTPSGRRPHRRWLYPWRQHPRYRRLASRCCPAEQRLASCESNGAVCSPQRLVMAINRRRVFPERPRTGKKTLRGNISPLCIQIKLIMARIDPHVFVLPCKMPLGHTSSEDLAAKGRYFRPKPPNHA